MMYASIASYDTKYNKNFQVHRESSHDLLLSTAANKLPEKKNYGGARGLARPSQMVPFGTFGAITKKIMCSIEQLTVD